MFISFRQEVKLKTKVQLGDVLRTTRELLSEKLYENEEEHEQLMQIEKVQGVVFCDQQFHCVISDYFILFF